MDSEQVNLLKSCIDLGKGSLPIHQLESDYRSMVGSDPKYNKDIYPTFHHYLQSLDKVFKLTTSRYGPAIVSLLGPSESEHLRKLIGHQKVVPKKSRRRGLAPRFLAPRFYTQSLRPRPSRHSYSQYGFQSYIPPPLRENYRQRIPDKEQNPKASRTMSVSSYQSRPLLHAKRSHDMEPNQVLSQKTNPNTNLDQQITYENIINYRSKTQSNLMERPCGDQYASNTLNLIDNQTTYNLPINFTDKQSTYKIQNNFTDKQTNAQLYSINNNINTNTASKTLANYISEQETKVKSIDNQTTSKGQANLFENFSFNQTTSKVQANFLDKNSSFNQTTSKVQANFLDKNSSFNQTTSKVQANILDKHSSFNQTTSKVQANFLDKNSSFNQTTSKVQANFLDKHSSFNQTTSKVQANFLDKNSSFNQTTSKVQANFLDKHSSYKFQLENEARLRDLKVSFNTDTFGQKKQEWYCVLKVNGKQYSTYPDVYMNAKDAEEAAAKKYLNSVNKNDLIPERPQDFKEITSRITEMLRTGGQLWWHYIKEKYTDTYDEVVSDDWFKEAREEKNGAISFYEPSNGRWILSLNQKTEQCCKRNEAEAISISDQVRRTEPPPLVLPEASEDCDCYVFVTFIKDCSELWVRLIGEQYSDAYNELLTDIEVYYSDKSNKILPDVLDVGAYYSCQHEEGWYRVKLLSIEGDKATVQFIDVGDSELVHIHKIFLVPEKFLELPSQSIHCVLKGVELGFQDDESQMILEELVLGQSLAVEFFSKEEPYSIVLCDVSTKDDVNINELLLESLSDLFPKLSIEHGVYKVFVNHVSDKGEVYVNVVTHFYSSVMALLEAARRKADSPYYNDNDLIDTDYSALYFAKFPSDGQWHRARLVTRELGKVQMLGIDTGLQETVPDSEIILLKKVSAVLNIVPAQAISCRLHNVPSKSNYQWTPEATARLKELLSSKDHPYILTVKEEAKGEEVALVRLCQRIQPQNMMLSINDTLEMEDHLFSPVEAAIEQLAFKINNLMSKKSDKNVSPPPTSEFEEIEISNLEVPETFRYFDVFVTYAASPSNFAVQHYKNLRKIEILMGELNSFYNNPANQHTLGKILPGHYYALRHTDHQWYRVQVHQVLVGQVSGLFIDYGDCFCDSIENFQPLYPNFRHFPRQSFRATLAGTHPVHGDWTPEDCIRFGQLVENKTFVSFVSDVRPGEVQSPSRGVSVQAPPTLVITLVDTAQNNADVYIHDILIEEKRAVKSNPSSPSF